MKQLERYEIILAGLGGQGLILSGLILAVASSIFDGNQAVQTQSYAPLARGAPSRSEVIISSRQIDYPEVIKADVLLALSQDSYDEFKTRVKDNGIIVLDSDLVFYDKSKKDKIIAMPLTSMAIDKIGKEIVTSIMALGMIAKMTNIVSRNAVIEAIKKKAPRNYVDLNIKAFEAGYEYKR